MEEGTPVTPVTAETAETAAAAVAPGPPLAPPPPLEPAKTAAASAETAVAPATKPTTKSKGTFQAGINKFSKGALFFFNKAKAAVPESLIKIFYDPHKETIPAKDEPDNRQVKRDEDIKKYQAILKKYSESRDTVFLVNQENQTAQVAEQASISQYPEEGLQRIQAQREVSIGGENFTITAITHVDKGFSDEHQKQIRENLEGLVASIKDDKEFLKKLKEASDLKDGLSKDAESLLDNLSNKPDMGDSENPELKENISRRINELKALNTELGDKLSKNLKNIDLDKLEPSTVKGKELSALTRSSIEKSALAESYQVPKGSQIGAKEVSLAKTPDVPVRSSRPHL